MYDLIVYPAMAVHWWMVLIGPSSFIQRLRPQSTTTRVMLADLREVQEGCTGALLRRQVGVAK